MSEPVEETTTITTTTTITKDDLKPILDRLSKIEDLLHKPVPVTEDSQAQTEALPEAPSPEALPEAPSPEALPEASSPEASPPEYQTYKENLTCGAKFLMLLVVSFLCMMLLNMFDMFNHHNILMLLIISFIISSVL
jgi:hypothetical protein